MKFMNKTVKVIALFLTVIGLAGVLSSLILKAPTGLYIGLGAIALAVAIIPSILPGAPSIMEIAFMTSFILATGAVVAHIGFADPQAAWFFLIAAVLSMPIVLIASRYLRSAWLKEHREVPEASKLPQGFWQWLGWLFIQGLSLGLTVALVGLAGYLGWHTWPKVSGNVLILTTLLLIFLVLGSTVIKRVDKKPERWFSLEGLLVLSNLLYKLLLPFVFVLLLLNFVMQ